MTTRYIYATKPQLFHANGMRFTRQEKPSDAAIQYLLNTVIAELLVKVNAPKKHNCTSLCGQPVQILIGFPHSMDVISSVSSETKKIVADFEDLLQKLTLNENGDLSICSLAMRFLPCSKVVEILDAEICLQ